MTDEAFFQSSLDASPNDIAARQIFAEWLDARGDWRAEGYVWMARHGKRPLRNPILWKWWTLGRNGAPSAIDETMEEFLDGFVEGESRSFHYLSRPQAEEALCRALMQFDRRARLETSGRPAGKIAPKSVNNQRGAGQPEMQR